MNRLIIDTETTGVSPNFNKTLTIGLLLIDVEKTHLNILDQGHIFVKHDDYNSTREAMRVNKIDLEQHELHAIHPSIACQQINMFIEKNSCHKTIIVGHRIQFDKGFLRALFQQGEQESLINEESEDTMLIWRNLQKQNLVPSGRSHLATLADHFDVDYSNAHDALADCHITAQVYHEMLKLK